MKDRENMNGGLSKSKKKLAHWTSAETPPPIVDLIHQNVFFYNFPKVVLILIGT